MKNLEKFKDESLEMNELINLKGGKYYGGDASCGFTYSDTEGQAGECDIRLHEWNDDGTYNGYEDCYSAL